MKPNFFTQNLRTAFASIMLLTMGISFSGCCSRNWYKNGEQDDVYAAIRPTECDVYVSVRNDDDEYMQYQEAPTTPYEPTTYTPTIYTPPTVIYIPPPVYIPRPVPVFIPRPNTPVYNESTNNWGNGNTGTNGNPKGTWTSTANPNGGSNGGSNGTNNGMNNGFNNNNNTNGYYQNGVYYYYPRIPKVQLNTPKDNTRNGGAVIPVTPNTNITGNVAGGQGGNDANSSGSTIYNAEVKEKIRVQEGRNRSTLYNNTGSNTNTNTSRKDNNSSNSGSNNSSTNSGKSTYKHTPSTSGEQRGTSTPRSGEGRTRTPR